MSTTFIMTEHWLKQPKMLPSHIVVECQKMKVLQPPQNSCKKFFPDRCRNQFGSNKTYLSMFNSFYYDWTLAKAAKNAAQPHCCCIPKMKVLQPPQHSWKQTFPDWCRNEHGSNTTYLSIFNSFYYDWTLAEAAKNAAQPHCCWVWKMKVLQQPQNSCK